MLDTIFLVAGAAFFQRLAIAYVAACDGALSQPC